MKKLNRKGFTLIELLAIIVILAIIMVVTIPTVLGSLGSARQDTFNSSANSVAEWFEKQYGLCILDSSKADAAFTGVCGANCKDCDTAAKDIASALKAAGVKPGNYSSTTNDNTVKFTGGRACVKLTKNSSGGDFKDVTTATAQSSGC